MPWVVSWAARQQRKTDVASLRASATKTLQPQTLAAGGLGVGARLRRRRHAAQQRQVAPAAQAVHALRCGTGPYSHYL